MKTILTAVTLLGAITAPELMSAADYDTSGRPQRVIVYKEECNDDDWYEWQTWTTGTITFEEGFYGGMGYSHKIDVEKRISRDPSNPTWQMKILNYHRNQPREGGLDELIIQYDPRTKKIFIPTQDFGMRTAVEDKEGVKGIPCMPEDATDWKAIGTGRFTEDAITGLGSDMGVPSFDVAVEESKEKPGLYRMVNPYVDFAAEYSGMSHHTGHTHYLYFDAIVPTQVMMTQQNSGVTDEKLGEIYLTSKGYEEMMAGKMRVEYAKYLGKVDQGVISFPVEAIGIKLPDYQKDYIWWTNTSGSSGLRLPSGDSGIGEVTDGATDECVEYFTLQGVRVAQPEVGGLYIVRRGGNVSKEIVR